jgi:hypothetical protein
MTALAPSASATMRAAVSAPAGPIARTGGETSASAVLAITLILIGTVLRRTGRTRSSLRPA